MLNFYSNYFFEYLNEYSFSLILFNILIYIYLIINIFLIFFIFDLKYIRSLNELKLFGNVPFVSIFLVLLILSLAGIPPLMGFLSKFLIFIYLFSKQNIIMFCFFLFVNIFIIYFYIQNLRFLISKNTSNKFIYKNNYVKFNLSLLFLINFFNFFNLFSILYFEELLIFLNFISSTLLI